jgi:hypothetical protein
MKRFRVTLLVFCLVLLYLGGSDLNTLRHNYKIQPVSIADLEGGEPPQQWLAIEGGYVDLLQAISTTGSVEVSSFLVPLKSASDTRDYRVLVETRAPAIVDALKTYHFKLESVEEQQQYVKEHQELFSGRRDVSGMVLSDLINVNNQNRLAKLKSDYGVDVPENVILFTEDKEPARIRGFLFVGVALLGLFRVISRWKTPAAPVAE